MAISAELIWRADMHLTDHREVVQRCPITHIMSRSRPTRRRASHGQYNRRRSTAYRLADLAVVGRGQMATRDLEVDLGIRRLSTSCALYFGAEVSKESAYRKSPVLKSYSHLRRLKRWFRLGGVERRSSKKIHYAHVSAVRYPAG